MHLKNGVLEVKYPEGLEVTLEVAKEIVRERQDYTSNVPYPVLVDMSGIKNAKMAAMKYWASETAYQDISRIAIYSKAGLISRILINLWFKIDKPVKPTKYFNDEGSARLFLLDLSSN